MLSWGGINNKSSNGVEATTRFLNKPAGIFDINDPLSSDLRFLQTKTNLRASLNRTIAHGLVFTAGTALSRNLVHFDLYNTKTSTNNVYWNWLPFANINKTWDSQRPDTLVYH